MRRDLVVATVHIGVKNDKDGAISRYLRLAR